MPVAGAHENVMQEEEGKRGETHLEEERVTSKENLSHCVLNDSPNYNKKPFTNFSTLLEAEIGGFGLFKPNIFKISKIFKKVD